MTCYRDASICVSLGTINQCCTPQLKSPHLWFFATVAWTCLLNILTKSQISLIRLWVVCVRRFHVALQVIWVKTWRIIPARQQNSTDEMLMPWNWLCCLHDDAGCTCSQCLAAIIKVYFCHSCESASSSWSSVETGGGGSGSFLLIIIIIFKCLLMRKRHKWLDCSYVEPGWRSEQLCGAWERKKGLPGQRASNPPKVVNKQPTDGPVTCSETLGRKITPLMSISAAVYRRRTSDGQVGGGLHFPNAVLCQAGVGPLIAHWCLLNPQQEVLFVISDVVPADKNGSVLKAVVTRIFKGRR